ncbi:hypothetical protein GCM10009092_02480 [Bowmanella denitrificans]|uniref:Uncharacterized protein n=1 Tax=Bowmanella denitrificans TaxID=366582 RepID=A0ABN0WLT8_9ALTE
MVNRLITGFAVLIGLAGVINGAFMTIAPESWESNSGFPLKRITTRYPIPSLFRLLVLKEI